MGLPVGGIVLVQWVGEWAAQRILLNHTYKVQSDAAPDLPFERSQEIAAEIEANAAEMTFRYLECLPNNYALKKVRVQVISPIRYQYAVVSSTKTGSQTTSAKTGNVAAFITLQTGIAGRREVANKHIGPLPGNVFDNGAPFATYVDKLDDLGSQMCTAYDKTVDGSAIVMKPVIWHRTITQSSEVKIWQTSDRIGTMRRRTLRVGE